MMKLHSILTVMPLLLNIENIVVGVIEVVNNPTNAIQSDYPVISVTF